MGELPDFRVFPEDVRGVVEVKQQAFATIQKSEAKKVVVDERRCWTESKIDHPAAAAFFGGHLRAEGGIPVHVLDVARESWVGVVNEIDVARVFDFRSRSDHDVFVDQAILKTAVAFAEQA